MSALSRSGTFLGEAIGGVTSGCRLIGKAQRPGKIVAMRHAGPKALARGAWPLRRAICNLKVQASNLPTILNRICI